MNEITVLIKIIKIPEISNKIEWNTSKRNKKLRTVFVIFIHDRMIFDRYRYFFLSKIHASRIFATRVIQLEELDFPEEAKHYFCT